MGKHIFILYETHAFEPGVEILGYATSEEEADRIAKEWEEYDRTNRRYNMYNWQEMVLEDDCLDGIALKGWK